jgi:hypothetical protein
LGSDEVDYECELAVVIGRECKNAVRENALRYVLGYTCANDVSARDWQLRKGGGQWNRGKTFDSFFLREAKSISLSRAACRQLRAFGGEAVEVRRVNILRPKTVQMVITRVVAHDAIFVSAE